MNIYDEYSNSVYKADFFRNIKEDEKKKELWNNMTMGDKKSLFSWLSISDIIKFIVTLSDVERKNVYQYIDKNKLRGIYNALGESDKEKMADDIDSNILGLMDKKEEIQRNMNDSRENINKLNNDIAMSNVNIANYRNEINDIKNTIKNNKIDLRKATKEEKKKYKQMLKASKCSVLDKIGIIAKYRANRLANITEEYLELSNLVSDLKEKDAEYNMELDKKNEQITNEEEIIKNKEKEIKDNNSNIKNSISDLKNVDNYIKNLSNAEKKILGRKLSGKKAINRVINTNKFKNKKDDVKKDESIVNDKKENVVVEEVDNTEKTVDVKQEEVVKEDTKKDVDKVVKNINSVSNMGVSFHSPVPVCPSVKFNSRDERIPVNIIDYKQAVVFYSVMDDVIRIELRKSNSIDNTMEQGRSLTRSKGNVSIFMLIGIMIMLLCMYFFII